MSLASLLRRCLQRLPRWSSMDSKGNPCRSSRRRGAYERRGEGYVLLKSIIAYLEQLTVSEGRLAGQPLTVMPWQRRFVRGAFADGVGEAALSIGRGNGKSTLVAGIAAAAVDGPLVEPRGQCLVIAAILHARDNHCPTHSEFPCRLPGSG